jgi:hypothetical protein
MPVVEVREITNNFEYEKECEAIVLSRKKISGTKPISAERYLEHREEVKSNNSNKVESNSPSGSSHCRIYARRCTLLHLTWKTFAGFGDG